MADEEFDPPPPENDGQPSDAPAKVSVSRLFFPERMDTLERGAQLQRFRTMIAESMSLSGHPPDAVEQFKNKFDEHPYGSQEWEQDISPWVSFL